MANICWNGVHLTVVFALIPLVAIYSEALPVPPFGNTIEYTLPGASVKIFWNTYGQTDGVALTTPQPPITDSPSTMPFKFKWSDDVPPEMYNRAIPDPEETADSEPSYEKQIQDYEEFYSWYKKHESGNS